MYNIFNILKLTSKRKVRIDESQVMFLQWATFFQGVYFFIDHLVLTKKQKTSKVILMFTPELSVTTI